MKQYSAAAAKERFSLLLDAAERGEPVIIERSGVRFREKQIAVRERR